MKKLSVSEVSRLAGKTSRQIRNLCAEGKLPCHKEKISTGTKYWIYTDTEEFKKLCGNINMEEFPVEGEIWEGNEEIQEGNIKNLAEVIAEMKDNLIVLAKEAGKAELLTDNLMTSEQNVKFYQDEYFKIKHELETARKEISVLKQENESLKAQKNKKWWQRGG